MVNQILAEEIRLELRKLQQEKEEYEDCCRTFSKEVKEEENEFYERLYLLNQQRDECYDTKDQQLQDMIEASLESLDDLHGACSELLDTVTTEAKDYYYQCDLKEEDLRRQLQRLEVY